jgi:hypothetical protein
MNTRFYRGYVVSYDRYTEETYEIACCHGGPHTSWQAAEACARRQQRLYGGTVVTQEAPSASRRRIA